MKYTHLTFKGKSKHSNAYKCETRKSETQELENSQMCYLAIRKKENEIWGHCAKWNKSSTERQILYDPTCMWNQKQPNS